MPDIATATTTSTTPSAPAPTPTGAPPTTPTTPAPAPETVPATVTNGQAPKSFKESLTQTMNDQGLDFGMDDHGRWTLELLAKPETIEGHSVEDLERIAQGEQPQGQHAAPAQPTVQLLSQQQGQQQAQLDPRDERISQLTTAVEFLLKQNQMAPANGQPPTAPTQTPSMRDHLAKQLEEKGYEPELADVFVGAMDQHEQQLRSQIAAEFNLPQMSLQSDLVRLYNTYGEDFKASLPAIELVRRGDPTIPLEQAYEGVRLMRQALGITGAPQQAPTNGATATPSQPTVNLSPEQAKALLAKRDLMRTESGMNGTEAKPSNVKKSFGEMLHDNMTQARRQGRVGG